MQLLTGQIFPNGGELEVFGRAPAENAGVLRRICFIKECQRYPEDFNAGARLHGSAPGSSRTGTPQFAERLVADFRLPLKRRIKKLSRGQLSAVGVIVGLASRAPLTFFDEPYLGLDAVARHIFYDRLLEDYAEHPRTVVLSTHLIDEVAQPARARHRSSTRAASSSTATPTSCAGRRRPSPDRAPPSSRSSPIGP